MVPIQMVDLKRQYLKIKTEVDQAIADVVQNTSFINGKAVTDFSAQLGQFLEIEHVVPCANGTDALQIAMMALGLEPGDEVITPSFTYIATTEVMALLRLNPVFVDVDPSTFCLDANKIRESITPRTKAIVPVHLYGQSAAMEEIMAIAKEFGLSVIEDNAQAIGATIQFSDGTVHKTGTIGDIGCTSFFPSKNLGCFGDGGAIVTRNAIIADKMRMIANHGQSKRYYHDMVGCNSRLDSIQAAVLNVKIKHLNQYNEARRQAAAFYSNAFASNLKITTPLIADGNTHVFHQYTILFENNETRNRVKAQLQEAGIQSMIYYPSSLHLQKAYAGVHLPSTSFPVSENLCERVLSLPMHSEMTEEIVEFICSKINLSPG